MGIVKSPQHSTTVTDISARLQSLGVRPIKVVICKNERLESKRFGFVTFSTIEIASQLVEAHFPVISWPVPGASDHTIRVAIDYAKHSTLKAPIMIQVNPPVSEKQQISLTQAGTTAGP
ncbi:hypothetical protein PSHT_13799 [Puccinia striiformis]|uniref:RRM domain-containing protein n=3 Tax=Puccinia striiformis TaxID=27350 RepID=A0A2S4UNJ5_9BASI|nr:hypothetical protein PSHT_13799 [Puccinia striiformis]